MLPAPFIWLPRGTRASLPNQARMRCPRFSLLQIKGAYCVEQEQLQQNTQTITNTARTTEAMANVSERLYYWMIATWALSLPFFLVALYHGLIACIGTMRRFIWYRQLYRVWRRNHIAQPATVHVTTFATNASSSSIDLVELATAHPQFSNGRSDETQFSRSHPGLSIARVNMKSGYTGLKELFL